MSNLKTSQTTQLTAPADNDVLPIVDVSDQSYAAFGTNKWITRQAFLGIVGTPEQVFNVLDYGAVGNGTTDDSTAIQACIDAAITNGGGIVYFPGGNTYKIVTGLTVDPSTLTSLLQFEMYGAILNYTGTGDGLTIDTNIATSDVQHAERSAHFFGLHMKGSSSASCGLRLKATNCSFRNSVFEDFTSVTAGHAAVILDGLFHFWVEENIFDGLEIKNTGNGIYFYSEDESGGSAASLGNNHFRNINIWVTQDNGKGIYGASGGMVGWANASRCVFEVVIVHPVNADNVIAYDLRTMYLEGAVFISPSIDIFGTCASLTGFDFTDTNVTLTIISPTCFPLAGITNFYTGGGNFLVLAGNTPSTLLIDDSGNITAPSYNNVAITAPASEATLVLGSGKTVTISAGLTIAGTDGKTLTVSNSLTLTGTDASSINFDGGGTVAYLEDKLSVFAATTSAELASVISDETGSGSLVFANSPTIVTPTIASFANANHNHTNSAGGGTLTDAALSAPVTIAKGGAGVAYRQEFITPDYTSGNWSTFGSFRVLAIGNLGVALFTFLIPPGYSSVNAIEVIGIADATETIQFDLDSNAAAVGDTYSTRSDTVANQTKGTTANKLWSDSITGVTDGLTLAANDVVGIKFTSNTDFIYLLGLRVRFA